MLVDFKPSFYSHDHLEIFNALKEIPDPVTLTDHHNCSNRLRRRIRLPVQAEYHMKTGRPLLDEVYDKYPLFEHMVQTVTDLQRLVMANYRIRGRPIDESLEPHWEGIAGLKLYRAMDFKNIVTTGALGPVAQEAVYNFYQRHDLLSLLEGLVGRKDGEPVYKFKGRLASLFCPVVGSDDQLKILFYSYAVNGIDALWIDPDLDPEKDEGKNSVCDHIENTPYYEVVKDILGRKNAASKTFKTKVFGPYSSIGQGIADRVLPRYKEYLKLGKANQQRRLKMSEEEIGQLLIPHKF